MFSGQNAHGLSEDYLEAQRAKHMATISQRVKLYREINALENHDLYNLFRAKMEQDYKDVREKRHLDNFRKLPLVPGFERLEDLP